MNTNYITEHLRNEWMKRETNFCKARISFLRLSDWSPEPNPMADSRNMSWDQYYGIV